MKLRLKTRRGGFVRLRLLRDQGSANAHGQIAKNAAAKSPWGPADEIGTLNMMTDASRADVLKQVTGGKIYDLGVEMFVGMPTCCACSEIPPSRSC